MTDTNHINNPDLLKTQQYNNADRLSARIRLHQNYSTNERDLYDWYFERILAESPKQAKVLELGTGRGDMWYENAHCIPDDWDITLTDLSDGMIEDNKEHLGELSERMTYDVVNAMDIPYPNANFDIVFANYMLYHVPDVPKAIAEIYRILKPNGLLFAATNGENHMGMIYKLAQQVDEITAWESIYKDTFTLQNGISYLMKHFYDVRLLRFDSHLQVTDAQPILDYIESMVSIDGDAIIREQEDEIRADIHQVITADGGVQIEKETGFFIAQKTK